MAHFCHMFIHIKSLIQVFFGEMLNSEEKGLVSSQYCMLYRDILVKVGDKLSELEKIVLKSVLVVNIGRMAFHDKTDALKSNSTVL